MTITTVISFLGLLTSIIAIVVTVCNYRILKTQRKLIEYLMMLDQENERLRAKK